MLNVTFKMSYDQYDISYRLYRLSTNLYPLDLQTVEKSSSIVFQQCHYILALYQTEHQ